MNYTNGQLNHIEALEKNTPNELKNIPQWVIWKFRDAGGKRTKAPVHPRTFRAYDVHVPDNWVSFGEAIQALEHSNGRADGIGFAFNHCQQQETIVGIDIDNCFSGNMDLDPFAWNILNRLNSYTEISPSGQGLHILLKVNSNLLSQVAPKAIQGKTTLDTRQIELFTKGYMTFTGDVYDGLFELRDSTSNFLHLYKKTELYNQFSQSPLNTPPTPCVSNRDVLEKLFHDKDGAKWSRLYYTGEWASEGYPSNSEATMALLGRLAYYAGGDRTVIDSLYRQSKLLNPKWDKKRGETTWGEKQIDKAINGLDPKPSNTIMPQGKVTIGDWGVSEIMEAYESLDKPPKKPVVGGLINDGSLNIFYGAPGAKKSLIVLDLCSCVAVGEEWLPKIETSEGHFVTEQEPFETSPKRILWIDYDNGTDRTGQRIGAAMKTRGVDRDSKIFSWVSMAMPRLELNRIDHTEQLAELVSNGEYGLVVIDNLTNVSGGVEENTSQMADVMGNLRWIVDKTGVAFIVIHHQRKGKPDGVRFGDMLRGHSSIEAALDLALVIESSSDDNGVVMTVTKSRDYTQYSKFSGHFTYENDENYRLQGFRFFSGKGTTTKSENERTERCIAIRGAIKQLSAENGEPPNQSTLVKFLQDNGVKGIHRNTIKDYLGELINEGEIKELTGPKNQKLYVIDDTCYTYENDMEQLSLV